MRELYLEVTWAREVLNEVFFTSSPFVMLGYSPSEIAVIHGLYGRVRTGGASTAGAPFPGWWHHGAKFEGELGDFTVNVSKERDFACYGLVSIETQIENGFSTAFMPQLFLLSKVGNTDFLGPGEITRKVLSGGIYRPHTGLSKSAAKIPGLEHLVNRRRYESAWLDERTKIGLVVKFIEPNYIMQLRKISNSDEEHEVWGGVKENPDQAMLEKVLSESKVVSTQAIPEFSGRITKLHPNPEM